MLVAVGKLSGNFGKNQLIMVATLTVVTYLFGYIFSWTRWFQKKIFLTGMVYGFSSVFGLVLGYELAFNFDKLKGDLGSTIEYCTSTAFVLSPFVALAFCVTIWLITFLFNVVIPYKKQMKSVSVKEQSNEM